MYSIFDLNISGSSQLSTRHHRTVRENAVSCGFFMLYPVLLCVVIYQMNTCIEEQCREAVFPTVSVLNGSVLYTMFLSSSLCLISHLAFPLCAPLVIVFLWSALAFDMQTPKTLAALQIKCLSQQYSHSLSHCVSSPLSFLVFFIDLKTGGGPMVSGDGGGCHLLKP